MVEWRSISCRSGSFSAPGLRRISSGTPSLPMSWSREALAITPIARLREAERARGEARVVADLLEMASCARIDELRSAKERPQGALVPPAPPNRPRRPRPSGGYAHESLTEPTASRIVRARSGGEKGFGRKAGAGRGASRIASSG